MKLLLAIFALCTGVAFGQDAMPIVQYVTASGVAGTGDFANLSSQADTFVGWVNSAKQAFRKDADAKSAA